MSNRIRPLPVAFLVCFICLCAQAKPPGDDSAKTTEAPLTASAAACRDLLTGFAGHVNVAKFLNCPADGCVPQLHLAIKSRDWPLVEELLRWGAEPMTVGPEGHSAYTVAETIGEGLRFQNIVASHRGVNGQWLPNIRAALLRLKISPDHIDQIIARSADAWPIKREVLFAQALDTAEAELILYLIEVKGRPIQMTAPAPVPHDATNRWDLEKAADDAGVESYQLWGIALLSPRGGNLLRYLQTRNFPILDVHSGTNVLSLFVGSSNGLLHTLWDSGRMPANSIELFVDFLKRGANPTHDSYLIAELFYNPEAHEPLWRALAETDYPAKAETVGRMPGFFALYVDIASTPKLALGHIRGLLASLGVNMAASYGPANYTALFSANSREMARYLIEQCGVDPRARARPGGMWDLPPGDGTYDAGLYMWVRLLEDRFSWDRTGARDSADDLVHHLRTRRWSQVQGEWQPVLDKMPERERPRFLRRMEVTDYLLHEVGSTPR